MKGATAAGIVHAGTIAAAAVVAVTAADAGVAGAIVAVIAEAAAADAGATKSCVRFRRISRILSS